MTDFPPEKVAQMLAAGLIAPNGRGGYLMTEAGRALMRSLMRQGTPGFVDPMSRHSVDSVQARARPKIKKKGKRR